MEVLLVVYSLAVSSPVFFLVPDGLPAPMGRAVVAVLLAWSWGALGSARPLGERLRRSGRCWRSVRELSGR
ncbi:MAG: hypothetical protein LC808_36145 [Actinobacteria bacterium]|nr:hypothetical protein [Actinomycetota bacterium]